jgi:hypothetical protein
MSYRRTFEQVEEAVPASDDVGFITDKTIHVDSGWH